MKNGKALANNKSEVLDNYITSMRALVDVISVGAPGTHACTLEKLRKVGATYTEDFCRRAKGGGRPRRQREAFIMR